LVVQVEELLDLQFNIKIKLILDVELDGVAVCEGRWFVLKRELLTVGFLSVLEFEIKCGWIT
jgi:hypothetical protein